MNFEERIVARQKNFKKGVESDDARRRREDEAVQLRKNKKDEMLQKRRCNDAEAAPAPAAQVSTPSDILQLAAVLNSNEETQVIEATRDIRKRLSVTSNPPIQACIEAGIIPKMVVFCQTPSQELQFEAAWVLTNIASGASEQTLAVVQSGAVPVLVQMISSPALNVREQAIWCLGNIAGDCSTLRDLCLQAGMMVPMLQILQDPNSTESMMRNSTWSVSNLFRGKPPPDFQIVIQALPIVSQLLYHRDTEVATDATWAISYISDGPSQHIGAVIQTGCVTRLVEMLDNEDLVQPALRALGNIVTGTDEQTDVALASGCLGPMNKLARATKKVVRKECMWMLSNITAGNPRQIQQVIENGIVPLVLELQNGGDWDVKKEATWVLSNALVGGTPEQVGFFVQQNTLQGMCSVLDVNDVTVVETALDAIEAAFKVAKNGGDERTLQHFCMLVEQCQGIEKLEALQDDANENLYNRAVRILTSYFGAEDEEDLGAAGAEIPQGGFNFA